ncbi:hypothetical protein IMG5_011940 [Ichthyophthirius multifiliis]|uniref:Protein kinase domain-containing protein n=1 Tax=Ichthyophthirius multifiliis TaxID=5932 RepID=G0QK26_ICHMU|nr:hypothetical protein IMG5_011940 [Ichthyophthirius multifiliis]EGR34428.1 hypothetical protein IMG5_011940 [Ichthyophthirius multifiliis]|eukprot:XP_004039732.1 hypothetical protein IMG5_011940 [Ichthyophthirius multifiliis]
MNKKNIKNIQNYQIYLDKILGKGTFGSVYEGKDTKLNRQVAVKQFHQKIQNKPEKIIPALKNEIKSMQILNHNNIVQLYQVTKTERNLYIIVEYCNEGNLENYIKKMKNIKEINALNLIKQMIDGYQCLYQNNIVHRDIKPENILLHNNVIKIADFGFSKVVEEMNDPVLLSFVGTPSYMSPQILQKQNYSSKTDIWSMGMIFYEILYQKKAWQGSGYFELLDNILKKDLTFPENTNVNIKWQNLISKMLQIDEKNRINFEQILEFFKEGNFQENQIQQQKQINLNDFD